MCALSSHEATNVRKAFGRFGYHLPKKRKEQSMKLTLIRWVKKTFIACRLHGLFGWLVPVLEQLVWLTRLSKWAAEASNVQTNDFPSKWDYQKRYGLYKVVIDARVGEEPVTYLEFGVAAGHSFAWWMEQNQHPQSRFLGFDTFTGLPEDFGSFRKGAFDMHGGTPAVSDARGKFVKGLFQDTLPVVLPQIDFNQRLVLMLDADLYSSTLYVLGTLAPHMKAGDLVFFDEFSVPTHEFRAFFNFMEAWPVRFELVGAASNYYFTAFRVV